MNIRRLKLAMVTAAVGALVGVSVRGLTYAAANEPQPQVVSSRHIVNADYNCEVK